MGRTVYYANHSDDELTGYPIRHWRLSAVAAWDRFRSPAFSTASS